MRPPGYWFWIEPPTRPTMREIAGLIAERHGLRLDELTGPAKPYRISHPRQEAYALIYATGRFSLPQIGRFFGNRDHTTVYYGIRAYEDRIAGRSTSRRRAA
jgi:chromosomal replication initiator protein